MNSIAFIIHFSVIFFYSSKTEAEPHSCKDIDKLLSDVWRMGDSKRLWPEQDFELQQYCLTSIENNEKIIDFFDEIFPDNSHIQILTRLTSIERTRLLMTYCKNKAQRTLALKLMIEMNKAVKQMEKIRKQTLNKLIEFSAPDSKATLADLHQVLHNYEEAMYKTLKDENMQKVLQNVMDTNRRLTTYYLQNFKKIRLRTATGNPCPISGWKPTSLPYAEAVAFNRILYNL